MHQKCSNYAFINLLFGFCRSVWVIDLLVILLSPHLETPTGLSTPEVLRTKKHAPTPTLLLFSPFGFIVESIKEFETVSYHNPNLGFVTKAKACKNASQKWSPKITFHVLGNVRENVRESTPTFPSELSLWELESQWTPKLSFMNPCLFVVCQCTKNAPTTHWPTYCLVFTSSCE